MSINIFIFCRLRGGGTEIQMKKMSKHTYFRLALLLITFFVMLIITSCDGCGSKSSLEPGQVSAMIEDDGKLVVRASFSKDMAESYKGKKLYLFELNPGDGMSSIDSMEPIGEVDMGEDVSFTLSFDNNGAPRICSGFVTAFYDSSLNKYSPTVVRPIYVSNPEKVAEHTADATDYWSIKGISDPGLTHATALGISHTVVDITIEDYLLAAGSSEALCHVFGGQSYYFNADAIDELDSKISGYSSMNVNVFLRVYLGAVGEEIGELSFLSHRDAEKGREYYGINFSDSKALVSYCAFVDLLADRYCDGRVSSLIVGRGANSPECEVNSNYIESYELALRLSHNILRSHYSNATVYAAVDKNLKSSGRPSGKSAADFMFELAAIAEYAGDYGYGISAEMAATSDRVWYDNPNTELLTPADIGALTNDMASRDELLFNNKIRSIIITDFYIDCDLQSEASVSNRAASYAYTYYRAVDNGYIDAFIYSSVESLEVDGLISGGINENAIYGIFAAIDTDRDIFATVDSVIQSSSWTELYEKEGLREEVVCGSLFSGSVKFGGIDGYDYSPMFTLDGESLEKFEAVGGYLGLRREDGYSSIYAEFSDSTDNAAIIVRDIPSDQLSGDYFIVPMKIESEADQNYGFSLVLSQRDQSGKSVIYTSRGIVQSGKKNTAVFDISGFTDKMLECDVTVALIPIGEQSCRFTVLLDAFCSGNRPPDPFWTIFIIVACCLVLTALIVLFVIWFKKNYKPKTEEKKEADNENKNENDKPMPTVSQIKKQQTSQRTAQQTAEIKSQTSNFKSEK